MLASTFLTLAGLVSLSTAGYVLEDDYEPSSFFSQFDFFTGADPTDGYVNYVDQATAQQQGLINTNGPVYIGVDHTNVATGSGRSSVRITSQKSYNNGLIILDASHMPGGICGTWPAFWTVGPNWPTTGEIDIIEGVNSQNTNAMTLHTGPGCSITNNGMFSGTLGTTNCDVNAAGQATNAGCQIDTSNTASYGAGFNSGQGGVYATEWTSEAISIWFFPRSAIPSDITGGSPDPTTWGTAIASFSGSCNIDSNFVNQQIVFDTTFCGDWAGNVWSTDPVCSPKASTCQDFVQNNPSAFTDAYWSVNSLKVYTNNGATTPSASPSSGSSTSISIPATVASSQSVSQGLSIPPVSTSFATVPTPASVPTSSQTQSFSWGGGHHSHGGGGSFSWTGSPAAGASAPSVSAVGAPSGANGATSTTSAVQGPAVTSAPALSSEPNAIAAPAPSTTSPSDAESESSSSEVAAVTTSAPSSESGPHSPPGVEWITVSALQTDQFPSHNETQTRGTNARLLLKERSRAGPMEVDPKPGAEVESDPEHKHIHRHRRAARGHHHRRSGVGLDGLSF